MLLPPGQLSRVAISKAVMLYTKIWAEQAGAALLHTISPVASKPVTNPPGGHDCPAGPRSGRPRRSLRPRRALRSDRARRTRGTLRPLGSVHAGGARRSLRPDRHDERDRARREFTALSMVPVAPVSVVPVAVGLVRLVLARRLRIGRIRGSVPVPGPMAARDSQEIVPRRVLDIRHVRERHDDLGRGCALWVSEVRSSRTGSWGASAGSDRRSEARRLGRRCSRSGSRETSSGRSMQTQHPRAPTRRAAQQSSSSCRIPFGRRRGGSGRRAPRRRDDEQGTRFSPANDCCRALRPPTATLVWDYG